MSVEMPKCKITVLKRTLNQDLIDEYLEDAYKDHGPCQCFEDGQIFIIERLKTSLWIRLWFVRCN